MTTKRSATVAFVVGAVAGADAAIQLEPQRGARMRRRNRTRAGELDGARARLDRRLKLSARV
jgi:gas vesicle protein